MQPNPGLPSVDVQEANRRVTGDAATKPLIVDVREPDEFAAVRVDGVAFVPMSRFADEMAKLPKDRPLLILCASGSRSSAVTAHLLRNGFTDVANVTGGITEWQRAGLPVRRGPIAPGEGDL
ncbi:MAG: rhodanese-like domain-containing protein [Chloroflexota bacterium]